MIPFASQRGSGQDLATHLLNEFDNEYMELADLRGSVADDLHGAFAEWEAQAVAMTKCKNYLYSLSINPDHRQGPMPRDLYGDYIDRVEERLGLAGQPRAVVMHIKEGREHAHVVWSRIDIQEMKAIHMAFDHDKLMGVTRQFAREHDIALAPGYHQIEERQRQTYRQLSLYEKAQADTLGISRDERRAVVTELWKGRDTPEAFLQALEYHGYILAQGKRPFVLVDIHGATNSLPKLIDDKAVTQKVIAQFLGEAGAKDNLPTVEDAKALALQHRQALKDQRIAEGRAEKRDQLKASQEARRAKLARETEALQARQERARATQAVSHRTEAQDHREKHLARVALIEAQREAARPSGLAAFLAKATGVDLIRTKIHAYRDRKREAAHDEERRQIAERQAEGRRELERRQAMQNLEMARKQKALEETEQRERQSLEKSFKQETSRQQRLAYQRSKAYQQEPDLGLHLKPPGRSAVPHKAKHRHTNPLAKEMTLAKQRAERAKPPSPGREKLQKDFREAVEGEPALGRGRGDTEKSDSAGQRSPDPDHRQRTQRVFKRKAQAPERGQDKSRER